MAIIKFVFGVLIVVFWGRAAFYMIESSLEIKEKYGISLFSLSMMPKSKLEKIYSDTPKAKKHSDISKRNGVYFLISLLIIFLYSSY